MKTKILPLLLALGMCLSLAACGHTHVWQAADCSTPKTCSECGGTEGEALGHAWQDATCAAPKTCSVCGETEGEALGHTWQDATCAAPKTCSVCDETEGEALPHTLSEANYQSGPVCSVCGETAGEPLTASFEAERLNTSQFQPAELGVTYDYHAVSFDDHSVQQTNHATFENYRVVSSDDTYAAKEGYEWQIVQLHILSDDPTAASLGWTALVMKFDYYSGASLDEDAGFTVNYNGIDYECQCKLTSKSEWNADNTANDLQIEFAAQVPIGYDGILLVAHEAFSEADFELTNSIPENISSYSGQTLRYFRMGQTT